MKMLLRYVRPHAFKTVLDLLIKLLAAAFELLIPWILEYMIDAIIPQKSIPLIVLWGGIMILCSLGAFFSNVIANRIASRIANDVTLKIRQDLYEHIFYMSCREVDAFTVSSLISRISSDTYNLRNMLNMTLRIGVRAPVLLIGGIAMTVILDPVLSLVMLATLPLIVLTLTHISGKGLPLYVRLQRAVDHLVLDLREFFTGIRVIKALSQTEHEKERFDAIKRDLVRRVEKAGIVMGVTNPTMMLFLNLALSFVLIVGAFRVNAGLSSAGIIIAFMSYFTIISNAMTMVNRIFVNCTKGGASAGRIDEAMRSASTLTAQKSEKTEKAPYLTFRDVSFSYNGNKATRKNLENISFSLERGQTLGIIGATGAGKSTIIQLLLRFYDPDSGVICIDGEDIRSLPPEALRRKFGVTFQNDFLMSDTIRENIDFGRSLPEEKLRTAVAYARAEEFIASKEKGLDYRLDTRAANLSGGQKQRLLIARALAGNPEILVLDDASSALDYQTDALLRRDIREHFAKTTKIIIAQRISSIRHADCILVLDHGHICASGTDAELMHSSQEYRDIAESQLQGVGA